MNLQWILLAFFLVAIVSNIAKAMRNPMLKNVLRLISILVAFIITFILQMTGLFQNIAATVVEDLELASQVPEFEGVIGNAIGFLLPFITTILSPLFFTLAFAIIYFVLKVVHVNLVYRFITKRQRRKEIKEFKLALKEEKRRLKQAITDNEARFLLAMEELAAQNPEIDTYNYESLDDDEIEKMVEKRIKAEKKKKKKAGFFKESKERKAISLVCGVICGFLLFGITWMGMFYSMDVLSDVTDGIKNTNADDTKIYQAVELVDKHLVTPYEESFVYKLYDSMAMVDMLNYTVRAGGKLEVDGETLYADDIMRDHMMRAVRLACEITSAKSEQVHVGEDISTITKDPMTVSLMADFLVALMEDVESETLDPENPANAIVAGIINNYKGEDAREVFIHDLTVMSDLVVVAAENRVLAKVISESIDVNELIGDRELLKDLVGAMSKLSFYGTTMENAFTLGVDMVGTMLMPADDKAAFEMFVNGLVDASNGSSTMSAEDVAYLNKFIKNAATYEKSDNNTSNGILAFLVDPLYRAEYLKDEANVLKDRGEQLKANADQLILDGEALKAEAEQFQADADALASTLESSSVEIGTLEFKKINDPENFTEEDQARLDYFHGLMDQKENFLARADELRTSGEDLKTRGEVLKAEAEDLADDVQDLADRAQLLIDQFEENIKGFTPFITFFMNWNSIQKPFMIANEDKSVASMALSVDGTLYVCNTDILDIEMLLDMALNSEDFNGLIGGDFSAGDEESSEGEGEESDDIDDSILDITVDDYLEKIPMRELLEQLTVTSAEEVDANKISPLTDLLNYLILCANTHKNQPDATMIGAKWIFATLYNYCSQENNPEACVDVASRMLAAKDDYSSFEYKGVTVEKMKASMNFGEEWTDEAKAADSEQLVDIIFTLLALMENFNTEAEQMSSVSGIAGNMDTAQLESFVGLLRTIGVTMDQMANTTCLQGLPSVMIEGILKNEMLSLVITPSMLYDAEDGYLVRLESGELTYESLMNEIADMATEILGKLNDQEV